MGQGYVGLPLALAAAQAGYQVFGVDNDEKKVRLLANCKSPVEGVSDSLIRDQIEIENYIPTSDIQVISESEFVLICVPTPLDIDHQPDLKALISATTTVAQNMLKGTTVIVESTIGPGTSRNMLIPILIEESGLKEDDFNFAFSPERIDPMNKSWGIKNTPKLVAGASTYAANRAEEFYRKFIDDIYKCSSLEIAEAAKLLENTFRLVNISLVNELSIYFSKIGIDSREVIMAAATKPYGFLPFYPGIGAGGHCIPVDPIYLSNAAKSVGAPTEFIDLADKVNRQMPRYFVDKVEKILGGFTKKKIVVVGIAYKPDISDTRESPAENLIIGLRAKGALVVWHDDLVKEWNGEKSITLSSDFDLAIIATPHEYLDLTMLGNVPILNTRGII